MGSLIPSNDFSHLQDVLGTLPMVKRYIVLCLCFPLTETASTDNVLTELGDALKRLGNAFPYLTGKVVYEGRGEGKSGVPKIVPLNGSIELLVKDLGLDSQVPSMTEMSKKKYPFSALDPDILLPHVAVSWSQDDKLELTAPVLIFQANLVRGGLLLTVSGNHHMMDMTGLGLIISLFSKACRNEPFTDEEVQLGNQPRRNAIPLLGDDYQPGSELDDATTKPRGTQELDTLASKPRWAYFNFKAENLARLKQEASNQKVVPYISTDDAIGALCWQRIAKAREQTFDKQTRSYFCRPLSVRKYLGLKMYMGHMVDCVYENEVDVWERPIGEIAGRLRRILQQDEQIIHHIRAFATVLNRLEDKSKLINGANLNPNRDVVLSSYANIKCCELSFGPLLGQPEAARRPRMPVWPSLCYLMPKATNGDIAVAFCVGEEDMARLRQDEVLTSYADYLG